MKYSKGSKQISCYADGGQVKKKGRKGSGSRTPTRSGDTMRSGSVGSTTDTLQNTRRRQMDALGLADGGSVRRAPQRPAMPPPQKGKKPKRITTENPPGGRRPRAR